MGSWGADPDKWIIRKSDEIWLLYPPVNSFWGKLSTARNFEQITENFRIQTADVQKAKAQLDWLIEDHEHWSGR